MRVSSSQPIPTPTNMPDVAERKNNQSQKNKTFFIIQIVSFVSICIIALVINYYPAKSSQDIRTKAARPTALYNVVVIGAGTGGVSAAIQAAREGARVVLVEDTDWIGGQMTASGVSTMDISNPFWGSGLYDEFRRKIVAYYQDKGKSINTCYWSGSSTCFEPSVGRKILLQMIQAERNITLLLQTEVTKVITGSGGTITSLILNGKEIIYPTVVIDATEYGDIVRLSGAPFRVANTKSDATDATRCIQDITYTAVLKKYPNGVPTELKIPAPPPGYTAQTASEFAKIVTKTGTSIPPGSPGFSYPVNWMVYVAYRGIPDSEGSGSYTVYEPSRITKTGANWANDFSVNAEYLISPVKRKELNCNAKLRTIQLLYYIQNVLGESTWSVANDEGYDTSYNRTKNSCANIPKSLKAIEYQLPQKPYVRESIRIIGEKTLTAREIKRPASTTEFPSSIAIGDYPVDLHNCKTNTDLESSLGETTEDVPAGFISGPFQIPIELLRNTTVPNLITAEKNISQSRLGNGATRLQPITMLTGQAAGALAAISVKQSVPPTRVSYQVVQDALLKSKSILHPFTDIPPDNPYFYSIQKIALRNIMDGIGNWKFDPVSLITREQMAVVLSRIFSTGVVDPPKGIFTDVSTSNIYAKYIEGIYNAGITSGCQNEPLQYCPTDLVSNAQLATVLFNGWSKKDSTITPYPGGTPTYSDLTNTHWAYKYVESLAVKGILWYCSEADKRFCPDDPISRGAATFPVEQYLKKTEK